jgi:geranylgeranyl pyrophosphate synthase
MSQKRVPTPLIGVENPLFLYVNARSAFRYIYNGLESQSHGLVGVESMDEKGKTTIDIEKYLTEQSKTINQEIEKIIPHQIDGKWVERVFGKASYAYDVESIQKSIADPIWNLLDRGGKRWRPILFLLSLGAVGGDSSKYHHYSAMFEIVHNGCVTADTLIWTAEGIPKPITEINVGDNVLSLDGDLSLTPQTVIKKHVNGIKPVLEITMRNRRVTTTLNHPFLTGRKKQPIRMVITQAGRIQLETKLHQLGFTISSFCDHVHSHLQISDFSVGHMKNALMGYSHCTLPYTFVEQIVNTIGISIEGHWIERQMQFAKADIVFEWKEAKDLKVGDLVVITKDVAPENGVLPELHYSQSRTRDRNKIPDKFTLEMAQLAGFLLGDGSIDKGRTTLCIPQNGIGRKEYEQLVVNIFRAKPSLSKDVIVICSIAVSELFASLGLAKYATQKEIPEWVFRLPRTHRLAFIKGYLDSDGTVSKKGQTIFECSSEKLIIQLKALLDSMGFITGNVRNRIMDNSHFKKYIKKMKTRMYSISLSSPAHVLTEIGTEIEMYQNRLSQTKAKMVQFRQEEAIPSLPNGFDIQKLGFNTITRIKNSGEKETFDITVENTHNYFSNGIITHNTLMVDDIEDDSQLRRGQPCTHKVYGIDVAVNAGNAMYFLPYTLIRDATDMPAEKRILLANIYAQEMLNVHIGQGMDILWHRGQKYSISEDEYLQMCAYKTGTLARMAARAGALLGNGTPEQQNVLGKFSETIGVAFQIQDDLLNLVGEEFAKGKGVGEDIHEGKRTIMVLHTLQHANEKDKARLLEILNAHPSDEKTIREAISIIQKHGSMDYARKKARELVEKSWNEVEKVLPHSKAKEILHAFAEYLINRKV